ncbi:MAG: hypothetical protein R3D67_04340 [Hyphomicrobiaceae bacterium]
MQWCVVVIFCLLPGVSALADQPVAVPDRSGLAWMSNEEIRAEFSGQKLEGIYPSKRAWKEEIYSNGTTDYREGTKHWKGQWSIDNQAFCFKYPIPGAGGCFRITRISANCFELYEVAGRFGQSTLPPKGAEYWNGRMWHADRPTTCESTPSV